MAELLYFAETNKGVAIVYGDRGAGKSMLINSFLERLRWYQNGQRNRKPIGPNKAAAEQWQREVLSARVEGRYIKKSPDALTLFKFWRRGIWTCPKSRPNAAISVIKN